MPDESAWAYTIRVGFSDEAEVWVASVREGNLGDELFITQGGNVGEAIGKAAVAIMDVHDDEATEEGAE